MRKLDRGPEIAKPRRRREPRAQKRGGPSLTWRLLRWMLPSRPLDAVAVSVAILAGSAVIVNALMLQRSQHPAPLFAEPVKDAVPDRIQQLAAKQPAAAPLPAPRPAAPAVAAAPAVRGKPGLVLDIQRALAERGYYEGTTDGLLGPQTQQAIRDFEQANGLKTSGEPTDALLARILRARARGEITGSIPAAEPRPAAPEMRPSTRVLAVQRVLAKLGYGPLRHSGIHDAATRTAIEHFERDRGLAKTGQIGDRLLAELAKVTGSQVD